MTASRSLFPHQSPRPLPVGGALSLRPPGPGRLRAVHGRVWVTLGAGPHGAAAGDRVLAPGEALAVPRGTRLVAQAWDAQGAAFAWEPCQPGVAAAWRELRQALARTAQAAGRLAAALALPGWRLSP